MAKKPSQTNAQVAGWEDDPQTAVATRRPVPDLSKKPLAYAFAGAKPVARVYDQGTAEFRYWAAAEALRRGADFWAPRIGVGWQVGKTLKVLLDEGEDLNAYYDRNALNFFHGPGAQGTVWSCESPDVVCHEMGHAILDALKPDLWDAASQEAAAFHESFGDMSAILSGLQLQSFRKAVLSDTQGQLYRSSRLSRLAEQLGTAIRQLHPDAVEADCLRNAVNSFTYSDPMGLAQMGPASLLSSEPHSFSRVFTGAFFEVLAGILAAKASKSGAAATDKDLLDTSGEIADILVSGVRAAPVVPNFYSHVAAAMVQASGSVNALYPPILKAAFVRRSILSLHSAAQVQSLQLTQKGVAARKGMAAAPAEATSTLALPSDHYGLDRPILVQAASNPRSFLAMAADPSGALPPVNSSTAAAAFVDNLFRLGKVDYSGFRSAGAGLDHGRRRMSHKLAAEGGGLRLMRCHFDCGFTHLLHA
jgi:hypothetical protein